MTVYCETTKEKTLTDGSWTFSGNGGGIEGSLEDCIDCLFERPNTADCCGKSQVKEFCLKYGFFACRNGAIYPQFLGAYSSIDFVNLNQGGI